MIGHHIAQRTCCLVEPATLLYTDGLANGDLDVIDVAAIPQRFKNSVGEAERHHILDGLFTKVVIDAINLIFTHRFDQILIQLTCGCQVMAERFFDDETPELALGFRQQSGGAQLLSDQRKELRCDRHVEKVVTQRALRLIDVHQLARQLCEVRRIAEIALYVEDPLLNPVDNV